MENSEKFHRISIEEIETAIDEDINFSFKLEKGHKKDERKVEIKKLCSNPNIYIIDNFITGDECEHFIKLAKPNLQQALVSNNQKGFVSQGRTGKNYWIPHSVDKITNNVGERIAKQVGVPLNTSEQYQVIYYDKTEEYKQHYDSWEHDGSEKSKRCMKYGGQRMYTALCYLNDVEEGGHTRFTKLNINVEAKKGRLLVFQNVYDGTNKKHNLSEHAGTPVLKGEKWAFNLWFREKPRNIIVYDPDNEKVVEKNIEGSIEKKNIYTSKINEYHINNESKSIYKNFILEEEIRDLSKYCNFKEEDGKKRLNCWGANINIKNILDKISNIVKIDKSHFENINFIKYAANYVHQSHLDAYDFTTERGKKCMKTRGLSGQRILTITGLLTNNVKYRFIELNKELILEKGTLLVYNNVQNNSDIRNDKIRKEIINISENEEAILFHIYVRNMNDRNEEVLPSIIKKFDNPGTNRCVNKQPEQIFNEKSLDDFKATLNGAYNSVLNNDSKVGYNSLKFLNKVNWSEVKKTLIKLNDISKENNGILNKSLLEDEYMFDEYNPVIINDVINKEALIIIQSFIKEAINRKEIDLGDRQSNRFRARNETITRFLHYEVLELIRKITGKEVRPTYTYLSCYTKEADLPAHTDQPDCEYTVSFIIDKPENSSWPIYLDKNKQPHKHKGRADYTPKKVDCIACDCESGGLMIFNGTDHIHYREPCLYDYYNIVLLHYRIN